MTSFDLEDTDLLCELLSGDAHCKLVVIIRCRYWYLGQSIPSEYTLSSYLDAFIAQRYGANFTPICAQCSQMGTSFFWYLPIFYRKTDTRSALTVSNNHRKHTWNLKYPCAYMLGHKWVKEFKVRKNAVKIYPEVSHLSNQSAGFRLHAAISCQISARAPDLEISAGVVSEPYL